jgi:VWFA-related protein
MKRGGLGLLAMGVSLLAWAAEPPAPTFTAESNLVRVDLEVLGREGQPVGPLRAEHLVVKDDGVRQEVLALTAGQGSLDLVLLFDISGSMERAVEQVAATAEVAFRELREGDRVAVMTFQQRSTLLLRLTPDLGRVARTVRERVLGGSFEGGTAMLAGVDDAARYLMSTPRGASRRAVVIITDNQGLRSRKEAVVVNRLWEADAALHGLVTASRGRKAMQWYLRITAPYIAFLEEGVGGAVTKTGGVVLAAKNAEEGFPELIRRIRTRPALYYRMPAGPEGKFRKIDVELSPAGRKAFPGAKIYARRGYRIPGAEAAAAPGRLLAGIGIEEEEEEEEVEAEKGEEEWESLLELVFEEEEGEEEEQEVEVGPPPPPPPLPPVHSLLSLLSLTAFMG